LIILSNPSTKNIPDDELAALFDLYESTQGDNWLWHGVGIKWNFSAPYPCANEWLGITCSTNASGSIVHILDLNLNTYGMKGTIPQTVGNLTHMQYLDLSYNELVGTIPNTFGTWIHLLQLELHDNFLTGTIPSSLAVSTQMRAVGIGLNFLSGTIPDFIGTFSLLQQLSVSQNHLTGTIPETLWSLQYLEQVEVLKNMFTGTISAAINNLNRLIVLAMDQNRLTGTIPDATNMYAKALRSFSASNNLLHGTLPDSLFTGSDIVAITFADNALTGTLPALSLTGVKTTLKTLFMRNNFLTGTIPNVTESRLNLEALVLSSNQLTGSIHSRLITSLARGAFLLLDGNQLTGTIPQDWSTPAATLNYLHLDANRLRGTLPEALGNLPVLESFNLSSNHLSGTIPCTFQRLTSLQVLMLQNNQLQGNISELFTPAQAGLTTVQLSGNQLTGTLPAAVFQLHSLSSFAAVDNCFDSPLPVQAICRNVLLNALVLDGLGSATACRPASLLNQGLVLGSLPRCFLNMANLTTLHLSGTGLTGSIPANVSVSSVLNDLSLSHNLLVGDIPPAILQRDWSKLDLSYNRLAGTLRSARSAPYSNDSQLYLQHNRLSGVIPGSMHSVGSLSMLVGSLFSCAVDRRDLPTQDGDHSKYSCGSDKVDSALYVWIGLTVACLATGCVAALRLREASITASSWWRMPDALVDRTQRLPHLRRVLSVSHALCTVAGLSAAYCVVVLLPLYAWASSFHSTYTYQYAWAVSGAFLSGTTAFALETTFLLLQLALCGLCATWLEALCDHKTMVATILNESVATPLMADLGLQVAVFTAYLLVNITVVVGVNVGFVLATLNVNGSDLTVIQILLAVFKLVFNNIALPALTRLIGSLRTRSGQSIAKGFASVQLGLSMFNNIVIPCLVVALISPTCFYDALHSPSAVTSSYEYSGACAYVLSSTTLQCVATVAAVEQTSYTPQFAYSYQCSSSFITYYAPTFVTMCIISGIFIPAQRLLVVWIRHRLSPSSRLHALVTAATPRILREVQCPEEIARARNNPLQSPIFDPNKLVNSLLMYLALLLTFGAMFPPLAVCCAGTMLSTVLYARLAVGRYVAISEAAGRTDCVEQIEVACLDATNPRQLRATLAAVLTVSCLFYTLFLFDTLGDAVGFHGAYWVLIVVPVMPISGLALRCALPQINTVPSSAGAPQQADTGGCVELANVQLAQKMASDASAASNPLHAI
jgi:Leucine-rich repeat (LRR) protein